MKRRPVGRAIVASVAIASLGGCSMVAGLSEFDNAKNLSTTDASGAAPPPTGDASAGNDDAARDAGAKPADASRSDAADAASVVADAEDGGDGPDLDMTDLIQNPGFELGIAPWTTFSDEKGHEATLVATSAQVHSGGSSALVASRTATFQGPVQDVTARVIIGHAYTMSAWTLIGDPDAAAADGSTSPAASLSDAINLTAELSCNLQGGNPTTTYVHVGGGATNGSTWTQSTGVLQVPSTCDLNYVWVYVEGPAPGLDLYVDDVTLTP